MQQCNLTAEKKRFYLAASFLQLKKYGEDGRRTLQDALLCVEHDAVCSTLQWIKYSMSEESTKETCMTDVDWQLD